VAKKKIKKIPLTDDIVVDLICKFRNNLKFLKKTYKECEGERKFLDELDVEKIDGSLNKVLSFYKIQEYRINNIVMGVEFKKFFVWLEEEYLLEIKMSIGDESETTLFTFIYNSKASLLDIKIMVNLSLYDTTESDAEKEKRIEENKDGLRTTLIESPLFK